MALTKEEEDFLKNLKLKSDLEEQISQLNTTAESQIATKRSEITAIQEKLTTDVKSVQTQIDNLK